jgi:hypothetical protein
MTDHFTLLNSIVEDGHLAGLPSKELRVLIALLKFSRNGKTMVKNETLARVTGLAEKSVRNAISNLRGRGWFATEPAPGGRGRDDVDRELKVPNSAETIPTAGTVLVPNCPDSGDSLTSKLSPQSGQFIGNCPQNEPKLSPNSSAYKDEQNKYQKKMARELFDGHGVTDPKPVKRTTADAWQDVAIPVGLNTDRFIAAWADFCENRKLLKKPHTAISAKLTLASLAKMGHDVAVIAVENSTANGWLKPVPIEHALYVSKRNGQHHTETDQNVRM